MAVHDHEFKKRGVKIIAHSCDKLQSHVDWVNVSALFDYHIYELNDFRFDGLKKNRKLWWLFQDIKSYCPDIHGDFPYPIIGDETREIAVMLDMISEEDKNNPEVAKTVRALYIISPEHKLKLAMLYPMSTGRNVE